MKKEQENTCLPKLFIKSIFEIHNISEGPPGILQFSCKLILQNFENFEIRQKETKKKQMCLVHPLENCFS